MKTFSFFGICALVAMFSLSSFSLKSEKISVPENPVKLTVIYGHPEDPAAFEEYYFSTHQRLAEKIKGVSRMELTKFEDGAQGEKPQYYRMAELYFPSEEAMQETLSSPEGKAAVDDIGNFATGGVTVIHGKAENFEFKK